MQMVIEQIYTCTDQLCVSPSGFGLLHLCKEVSENWGSSVERWRILGSRTVIQTCFEATEFNIHI